MEKKTSTKSNEIIKNEIITVLHDLDNYFYEEGRNGVYVSRQCRKIHRKLNKLILKEK